MLAARGLLTWRNQHCICCRSRACPRRSESAWLAQLDLHAPRCGRRLRAELDEILKRANGVEERRNKVTHSQWDQPARKRKWPEPPCKAGPDRRSPNQTTPTRQFRSIQPVAHLGFLADQLRRAICRYSWPRNSHGWGPLPSAGRILSYRGGAGI